MPVLDFSRAVAPIDVVLQDPKTFSVWSQNMHKLFSWLYIIGTPSVFHTLFSQYEYMSSQIKKFTYIYHLTFLSQVELQYGMAKLQVNNWRIQSISFLWFVSLNFVWEYSEEWKGTTYRYMYIIFVFSKSNERFYFKFIPNQLCLHSKTQW